MTVDKREEVGGSGEKPDPAEEGKDDEEGGGGGRGDEEGEGDEGGRCELNQWFDAVGDSPLILGHSLLEGFGHWSVNHHLGFKPIWNRHL